MLQAPPGRSRREAIPRHSSANPNATNDEASMLLYGNRMNDTTMAGGEDVDGFYYSSALQTVLAGGYEGVRVFITQGDKNVRKWVDSKIFGVLRLVKVQEVATYPVVVAQVMQVDEAGTERAKVLEYEIPLNFRYDINLCPLFSAVRFQRKEFLGFYFSTYEDQMDFNEKLKELSGMLTVDGQDLKAIKDHCRKQMDEEFADQFSEAINVADLLSGQDLDKQAQEMRKILILAGMKVETELSNPETVKLIQDVLRNFDPNKQLDEDEMMFSSRLAIYEGSNPRSRRMDRNVATKRVTESYLIEVQKNEKIQEAKRIATEARQHRTDDLKKQFEQMKSESDKIKADFNITYDENGDPIGGQRNSDKKDKKKKDKKDKKEKKSKKTGGGFFGGFFSTDTAQKDISVDTASNSSKPSAAL